MNHRWIIDYSKIDWKFRHVFFFFIFKIFFRILFFFQDHFRSSFFTIQFFDFFIDEKLLKKTKSFFVSFFDERYIKRKRLIIDIIIIIEINLTRNFEHDFFISIEQQINTFFLFSSIVYIFYQWFNIQ